MHKTLAPCAYPPINTTTRCPSLNGFRRSTPESGSTAQDFNLARRNHLLPVVKDIGRPRLLVCFSSVLFCLMNFLDKNTRRLQSRRFQLPLRRGPSGRTLVGQGIIEESREVAGEMVVLERVAKEARPWLARRSVAGGLM